MNKTYSTRRRNIFLPIIITVLSALCLFGLVGCGQDALTESDLIKMGYKIVVIYDYQGGKIDDKDSIKIRVKENSKLPEPGAENSDIALPVRKGYSVKNFCVAKTDDAGNLVLDENNNPIPDRVWDFANDTASENITLLTQWWENYRMVLHFGDGYAQTKTVSVPREKDGTPTVVYTSAFKEEGYTFFGDYYLDIEETTKIDIKDKPYLFDQELFENSDDGLTVDVYGSSLDGTYSLITDADSLLNTNLYAETNLYFMSDVDLSEIYDKDMVFEFPDGYSGMIVGNGHKISNMKLKMEPASTFDNNFGIFRSLNAGANIDDLHFDNVSLELNLKNATMPEYNIGMLVGCMREGAKLNNVTVTDSTFDYKIAVGFDNTKLHFSEIVGLPLAGSTVTNSKVENLTVVGSTIVYTENRDYAVYLRFTQENGVKTLGEVYGLATVGENGKLSIVRYRDEIQRPSDDTYVFNTLRNGSFTVKATATGNDDPIAVVSVSHTPAA